MELYKLCHRKTVVAGLFFIMIVLCLFCSMKVSEEWAYVDGVLYEGYEAVQKNRQITEEFKGILTDEKVDVIIEKYGFPQEVAENYGGFRDSNYLNAFVTDFLTDGFMRGWNEGEYRISTCIYPIEETELGAAGKMTDREIIFAYTDGWAVFKDILNGGMMLSSILILIVVSTLFAGEKQAKMVPLLFTTKEGRKKDITVKILAAFTVTVCIWLMVVILDLSLCGYIYGFDGWNSLTGITKITRYIMARDWSVTIWTAGHFLAVVLFRSFIGVMTLCATTVYISAKCRSSFHAVSIAGIAWGMPILLWFLVPGSGFQLVKILIYASPLYHVMCDSIFDVNRFWQILIWIAAAWSAVCIIRGYFKYEGWQD